jgi:hypothetical protein
MFSFIKGIEPRDQIESTLAAQMAAACGGNDAVRPTIAADRVATAARLPPSARSIMSFGLRPPKPGDQRPKFERRLTINKFSRTFLALVEALKRYRSGGEKNKNALKHGLFTREASERRKQMRALLKESERFLRSIP